MFDHRYEHMDESMIVIQANIDDMNPEWSPYVTERLLEAGANDVYWIPIIMKKGRPALMLNVLVEDRRLDEVEKIIFEQTSTLGIRYMRTVCHRLGREMVKVPTEWGEVTLKVGYYKGELVQFAPEFSECEQIAKRFGIPLKFVYDRVRSVFMEMKEIGKTVKEN